MIWAWPLAPEQSSCVGSVGSAVIWVNAPQLRKCWRRFTGSSQRRALGDQRLAPGTDIPLLLIVILKSEAARRQAAANLMKAKAQRDRVETPPQREPTRHCGRSNLPQSSGDQNQGIQILSDQMERNGPDRHRSPVASRSHIERASELSRRIPQGIAMDCVRGRQLRNRPR